MIEGFATKEGTTRFIERFPEILDTSSYRRFRKLRLSSAGVGTYLGGNDSATDEQVENTIREAIAGGINVFDTAINYRDMRAERAVGRAIGESIRSGIISRDEIYISTKGGYLPHDFSSGLTAENYHAKTFFESGLLLRDSCGESLHSLEPRFLEHQLEQSLKNLNLKTVDLYYLQNPEIQLQRLSRPEFLRTLEGAFRFLEGAVTAGRISSYGLASWSGFRVPNEDPSYLSVSEIVELAKKVGGDDHHLAAIQLPLNFSKTEAVALQKQVIPGEPKKTSATRAASELRIGIFAASPLDQGKLIKFLPAVVKQHFKRLQTDAQYAIQFSRSCSGVVSALVGVKTAPHLREMLGVFDVQPDEPENFVRLFESPDRSLVR